MNENNEVKISFNAVILAVAVIVGLVGTAGYFYGKNSASTIVEAKPTGTAAVVAPAAKPTVSMEKIRGLFNGDNLSFGDKNSKLLFVEFSDPSCPFCHVAAGKNSALNKQMGQQFILKSDGGTYVAPVPEMKKLVDAGKAAFVWIYAVGHGSGATGTKALYCAQEKGKFWEVHDLLMSSAGYTLMNTTMERDANRSALDNAGNQDLVAKFLKPAVDSAFMKDCLASTKYDGRLTSDMAIARQFGFQGTPDFYVNTTNFSGAYSFTDMQVAVDATLK